MTEPDLTHWGPAANREINDANYKWACDHVFDPLNEPDPVVYFYDRNNPGVLYRGTEQDVVLLQEHGGSHEYWTRSFPDVGSTITVLVDGQEEQWPVEQANFAMPWW